MEQQRAALEAEKLKVVNHHYKIFQAELKNALEKDDNEVFCNEIDPNWLVRDAREKQKFIFRVINQKQNKSDLAFITKP